MIDGASASLEARCAELVRRLGEIGVEAAVAHVRKDTGELASGIRWEQLADGSGIVVSEGPYAAFVEFGTGVVGEGTYQGDLPDGWGYNEQRTPEAHDPDDMTRWFYRDRDGRVRSTRGQPACGYMAAAAEEMRQSVAAVAKEVLGK
ncbi:HK97 gp10 family phage protein [Adlercreutzia sp. R25]|uniref:HK97 gp10 family phage protein n=1 Tax=Adlercreutzia shanghongiae TaxID=3111773 RepID=UPI002DC00613|nr:HK97 gp10 family phage protein [Adlercreutzia sp. R25]MEC4272959.1 HK97 gp10 family phage protein [Adlercreutzia sp. R25]